MGRSSLGTVGVLPYGGTGVIMVIVNSTVAGDDVKIIEEHMTVSGS